MNCPVCGFANEDGALFCDKCKSDLEMPAPPVQASTAMNDQSANPAETPPGASNEEPIPLEPVALEPVAQSSFATVDQANLGTETPVELAAGEPGAEPSAGGPPPLPHEEAAATHEPSTATLTPEPLTSPKLATVRGLRMDLQYPIYPGKNYVGRMDDKPVDIDLTDQESEERVWASRQHAVITFEDGNLAVEDLNSLNGTFVNRNRVHPGEVKQLSANDVIQIGTVHLKVLAE